MDKGMLSLYNAHCAEVKMSQESDGLEASFPSFHFCQLITTVSYRVVSFG